MLSRLRSTISRARSMTSGPRVGDARLGLRGLLRVGLGGAAAIRGRRRRNRAGGASPHAPSSTASSRAAAADAAQSSTRSGGCTTGSADAPRAAGATALRRRALLDGSLREILAGLETACRPHVEQRLERRDELVHQLVLLEQVARIGRRRIVAHVQHDRPDARRVRRAAARRTAARRAGSLPR